MNNAGSGHNRAVGALLNAFNMTDMLALNAAPKAANIVGLRAKRLGAIGQYRQGKMRIGTARRIAFGNFGGALAAAIKFRQAAIINLAAVTGQRCGIGGQGWAR